MHLVHDLSKTSRFVNTKPTLNELRAQQQTTGNPNLPAEAGLEQRVPLPARTSGGNYSQQPMAGLSYSASTGYLPTMPSDQQQHLRSPYNTVTGYVETPLQQQPPPHPSEGAAAPGQQPPSGREQQSWAPKP